MFIVQSVGTCFNLILPYYLREHFLHLIFKWCVDTERALICLERQSNSTRRNLFKNSIFRLSAERLETTVTLEETRDETDKIWEDVRKVKAELERLREIRLGNWGLKDCRELVQLPRLDSLVIFVWIQDKIKTEETWATSRSAHTNNQLYETRFSISPIWAAKCSHLFNKKPFFLYSIKNSYFQQEKLMSTPIWLVNKFFIQLPWFWKDFFFSSVRT